MESTKAPVLGHKIQKGVDQRVKAKKKSVVDRIPNWAWLLISLAVALLVWTALSFGEKTGRSFCHPWEIPGIFVTVAFERGILLSDIASSLLTVVAGYLIGFVIALPLAILMAWYRPVRYVVQPWIQFIRNIPPLAYVPLIVLMLGVGRQPQITVITISTTLIMSITIYQGVVNIDETLIKAARVLGAKDKDVFVRVIAPASLPFILTAARLGASTALTTLIAAESVGSGLGLGMRIRAFNSNYEPGPMLLYIIIIGIIGLIIEKLIKFVERKLTGWQEKREI
ncbi:MAG TPA: ABC transporter permease [Candidatus Gemmiger avium]|nr:ABC transporter permease [Candidatus Gemmiger avium]